MKNPNDPLGNRNRDIPTCRYRSASNNCAAGLTSVRSMLDTVFQIQCGLYGDIFCQNHCGVYVLLCTKINVNCNGFCVVTSVFSTIILSIVRKQDLTVSACLCVHVFNPTLKACPSWCFYFSRRAEFEA